MYMYVMYCTCLCVRVSHGFDKGVGGISGRSDGVRTAILEPPSPSTLIGGSRVPIQPTWQHGNVGTGLKQYTPQHTFEDTFWCL